MWIPAYGTACSSNAWPTQGRALMMGTPRGRMNKLYEFSSMCETDPEWSYHCFTRGRKRT